MQNSDNHSLIEGNGECLKNYHFKNFACIIKIANFLFG